MVPGNCPKCGRSIKKYCMACGHRDRKVKLRERLRALVGSSCWLCGYDKGERCFAVMDFHHVDEKQKSFAMTARETTTRNWQTVELEARKCAYLCCRCHREHHSGLLEPGTIERIYVAEWAKRK